MSTCPFKRAGDWADRRGWYVVVTPTSFRTDPHWAAAAAMLTIRREGVGLLGLGVLPISGSQEEAGKYATYLTRGEEKWMPAQLAEYGSAWWPATMAWSADPDAVQDLAETILGRLERALPLAQHLTFFPAEPTDQAH